MSQTADREMEIIRRIEGEMQRMAEEAMRAFMLGEPPPDRFWQPPTDVYETEGAVVVRMELAGVDSSSLQVSLSGDERYLSVSGERLEKPGERESRIRFYRLEIYYGLLDTRVPLPPGIRYRRDALKAVYSDGFLTVTLPKRLPDRVPVQTEDGDR